MRDAKEGSSEQRERDVGAIWERLNIKRRINNKIMKGSVGSRRREKITPKKETERRKCEEL